MTTDIPTLRAITILQTTCTELSIARAHPTLVWAVQAACRALRAVPGTSACPPHAPPNLSPNVYDRPIRLQLLPTRLRLHSTYSICRLFVSHRTYMRVVHSLTSVPRHPRLTEVSSPPFTYRLLTVYSPTFAPISYRAHRYIQSIILVPHNPRLTEIPRSYLVLTNSPPSPAA